MWGENECVVELPSFATCGEPWIWVGFNYSPRGVRFYNYRLQLESVLKLPVAAVGAGLGPLEMSSPTANVLV